MKMGEFLVGVFALAVSVYLYKRHELKVATGQIGIVPGVISPSTDPATVVNGKAVAATSTTQMPSVAAVASSSDSPSDPALSTLTPISVNPSTLTGAMPVATATGAGSGSSVLTPISSAPVGTAPGGGNTSLVPTAVSSVSSGVSGLLLSAADIGLIFTISPTGHIHMSSANGMALQLKVNGQLFAFQPTVDQDAPSYMQNPGTWTWDVYIPGQQNPIGELIYTIQPSGVPGNPGGPGVAISTQQSLVTQVAPVSNAISNPISTPAVQNFIAVANYDFDLDGVVTASDLQIALKVVTGQLSPMSLPPNRQHDLNTTDLLKIQAIISGSAGSGSVTPAVPASQSANQQAVAGQPTGSTGQAPVLQQSPGIPLAVSSFTPATPASGAPAPTSNGEPSDPHSIKPDSELLRTNCGRFPTTNWQGESITDETATYFGPDSNGISNRQQSNIWVARARWFQDDPKQYFIGWVYYPWIYCQAYGA